MCVLSDKSIKVCLDNGWIVVEPTPSIIQPASIDLRLSNEVKTLDNLMFDLNKGDVLLEPHEFVLASTLEYVEMPNFLVGIVNGKSSIGRLGLFIHITAGYVDAGFKGNITLELYNCTNKPIRLSKGMLICQLLFETLTTECENSYGSEVLGSHYQNSMGTVYSKYDWSVNK